MGLDVRRDSSRRADHARRRQGRLAHSRALSQSVPAESGRLAEAFRSRARARDEQWPARETAPSRVPRAGRIAAEGDGEAVPGDRDRAGDQEHGMTVTTITDTQLAPKDYASDQEVRWCPGCGDYAILKAVQKACADMGLVRERTVFVSGIGCAARFPYYMSTYGFHTVHGRAPAIATGIKLANPDLDVWVMTGDGDGLSIGGNHMLHVLRRNVDLQIILFNNEIYGLTKGQYSPTSRRGTRSPSTPLGSLEYPVSACVFALGAGARFVARSVDTQQPHLVEVLKRAHSHHGTSFVEVF